MAVSYTHLRAHETREMNVQTIKDDESLFYKLVDKNFLLIVDWSGEDRQGMLYNFFNNRLQSMLGVQLVVSEDEVYQKYNQLLLLNTFYHYQVLHH